MLVDLKIYKIIRGGASYDIYYPFYGVFFINRDLQTKFIELEGKSLQTLHLIINSEYEDYLLTLNSVNSQ